MTIGTTVLQTQLAARLPPAFVGALDGGASIAYAAVPRIAALPEPLRTEVRVAFADSLRVLWQVMTGIAGVGVLASAFMRGLPLSGAVDDKWGMEEDKKPADVERAR